MRVLSNKNIDLRALRSIVVTATVSMMPDTANAQGRSVDNPRYQKQSPRQRQQSGRKWGRQWDVCVGPGPAGTGVAQLYRRGISQFLSPRSAIVFFSQGIDVAPDSATGYRGRAWASLSNKCNLAAILGGFYGGVPLAPL